MFKAPMIVAFALSLCLFASPLLAEVVFRVAYPDKENPPRTLGEGVAVDPWMPGISVELMRMVGEAVGVTVAFKRVPWNRCLYMLEKGLTDAVFHASYKVDRTLYGMYPSKDGQLDSDRRVWINRYVLYARKGMGIHWDRQTLTNLAAPLGTQLSNAVADDLREMGYRVEEAHSVRANMDKLKAGRISAYAEIETIADDFLRDHPIRYSEILKLSPPLREKDYYVLISKRFYECYPKRSGSARS